MPVLIPLVVAWLIGLTLAALVAAAALPPSAFTAALSGALALAVFLIARCTLQSRVQARQHQPSGASRAARASNASRVAGARQIGPPAIVVALVGGLLVGNASARSQSACRSALAARPTLLVAIDERATPGAHVTGEATSDREGLSRCMVHVSLRVQEGHARPGAMVHVIGPSGATQRGLRIASSIVPTGDVQRLRAWRGEIGETIDTLFGINAALVRALLIADQDGISPAVRDRFADAGLVHMLSISGLHVAIIAGALLALATALRIPRPWGETAAALVITLYVLIIGAPAPAVRSAVMLATMMLSQRLQRPVHPWTALALGAALPTVQPGIVLDLGYQLSVSGMASLVAARALFRRFRLGAIGTTRRLQRRGPAARFVRARVEALRALHGWRWTLLRECVTGVIATAVTAPLIAWTFGRVSIVAPLSNIVAGPVVAFVQPALFLAIVLAPWRAGARFVADATSAPLALLDRIATVSASVPHASLHVAPTLAGALCAGIASAAFVRASASRRMLPGMLVACGALVAAVWSPLLPLARGTMELHMLDVGQGDALALRTPRGRWIVIDAGRRWDGGDAGRRTVVPYLRRHGGDVAAFVMSHAHDDHVGGAASVADALHPLQWWEPAFVSTSSGYRAALLAVQRTGARWKRVHPGDTMRIDGVTVTVIAPDSAWTARQDDANETSVVARVAYGAVSFLLTGDAESNEERWMLEHTDASALHADVLKVAHHGSRTSSSPAFLDAVQPRLGLVSVGADNRYGHPSPQTLAEFARRGIPLLRTDREGAIVVSTDGRAVQVQSRGDRWTVGPR
jgi:competence protein ComEC